MTIDLFTPVVPPEELHPHFQVMLSKFHEGPRKVLQAWARGFVDRDGKFVREFQTTFNSSFWELYLNAAWHELGWTIDFRHKAPDFVITSPNDLCVEAVTANAAADAAPEWSFQDVEKPTLDEFLRVATIRLSNAVASKYTKFRTSYEKLAHVAGKPFVLAVAPFEQPGASQQGPHAMTRVLYGYDRPITQESAGGTALTAESWMSEIPKDTGAPIPLGVFAESLMPEISAVLFSPIATAGKLRALDPTRDDDCIFEFWRVYLGKHPSKETARGLAYSESLLDGLHIFINPFATHPLPVGQFANRGVALHTYDPSARTMCPKFLPDS